MRVMRMVYSVLILVFSLMTSCSAARPAAPDAALISGATMGTTYQVRVPGFDEDDRVLLQAQIESELESVNAAMSTYQPDSAISRFNQSRDTDWTPVPESLAEVVLAALQIAVATEGAFDPTVAPLVQRWGFGSQSKWLEPPAADELSQLLQTIGYRHLKARLAPPALQKALPELSIDLSAIAKGYAVDRLAGIVDSFGYRHYLVEIGGELRVSGFRHAAQPWRVGVEQPAEDGSVVDASLALTAGGVASSGDYRNFREVQGKRYSHIIDPRTGVPVEHRTAAVTVVANTAMYADGWATALMVLGAERGADYAQRHSLAARFVEHDAGQFRVTATSLYRQLPADAGR